MSSASVAILAKGRPDHLHNLVPGLDKQSLPPVALIVAVMQDRPYELPAARFSVVSVWC